MLALLFLLQTQAVPELTVEMTVQLTKVLLTKVLLTKVLLMTVLLTKVLLTKVQLMTGKPVVQPGLQALQLLQVLQAPLVRPVLRAQPALQARPVLQVPLARPVLRAQPARPVLQAPKSSAIRKAA